MNAKAEVFEDVTTPNKVSVIKRQLDKAYSLIIGTGILVAIIINIANVIGRYVFDSSIAWAEETLSFILIWVVFVGAAKVALNDGHLRVELFSEYLKGPLKAIYNFAIWGSICTLSIYMANESFKAVSLMYNFGQTSNVAGIPMYIPHAALFLGFIAMAVSTVVNMLEFALLKKRAG